MRLFVAIQPDKGFLRALNALQESLRKAGVVGKYLEPSNLHLTLAFIGEWAENVTGLLPQVEKPFRLTLSHFGLFPKAGVLWVGVKPSKALNRIAENVRHNLLEAGIPFDSKAFAAHITLVRKPYIPHSVDLAEIKVPQATMTVKEICLYRSDHGERGMVYTVIGHSFSKAEGFIRCNP